MQLPNSSKTEGAWGGFKNAPTGGYILGLMVAEEGTTGASAKVPNSPKLQLGFDIIEGDHSFTYKEWTGRAGKDRYLKLHLPVSNMAKLNYTLEHLGECTGGKAKAYVTTAIKKEDIDEATLVAAHLKTGAILDWNKDGFLEIVELVSIAEAKKVGATNKPKPAGTGGGNGGGGASEASFDDDSGESDGFGFDDAGTESGF